MEQLYDQKYILYLSQDNSPETKELLDIVKRYNLSDMPNFSLKFAEQIDRKTMEGLEVIIGESVEFPFLEMHVLCETDAILGYMGIDEIIDTFKTYGLLPKDINALTEA